MIEFFGVPTLVYFDLHGIAEIIRIIFFINNEEVNDVRYPFKVIDMSK
jgi:hypothetical protein